MEQLIIGVIGVITDPRNDPTGSETSSTRCYNNHNNHTTKTATRGPSNDHSPPKQQQHRGADFRSKARARCAAGRSDLADDVDGRRGGALPLHHLLTTKHGRIR